MTFHLSGLKASVPALKPSEDFFIRAVDTADLPLLQALSRQLYTDTRFFSDSHFSRERAQDLYSTWITLECQGRAQKVLVAESKAQKAIGYISCQLDSNSCEGRIGLVGVSPAARRKGVGQGLVLGALDWFSSQGAREVTVVTQAGNLSAQRLYQRCGFLTQALQIWYHKWYLESRAEPAGDLA
jgi:dTDP-4-amino-4,6-dideoxy-D-galactose acyltransferase